MRRECDGGAKNEFTHLGADVTTEAEGVVFGKALARVGIDASDVDGDGSVVRRVDEAVGPRALAWHVEFDVLAFGVLHFV